jgi:anti-sigma B factor antagonist
VSGAGTRRPAPDRPKTSPDGSSPSSEDVLSQVRRGNDASAGPIWGEGFEPFRMEGGRPSPSPSRGTPSVSPGGSSRPSKYRPFIGRVLGVDRVWAMPDTWGLDRTAEGLSVHGEIDLATAEPFEARTSEAVMDAPGSSVLLDLSRVTFMDSAGTRALIRVMKLQSGKSLVIQPSRPVFKVLQLVALTDRVLPNVEILEPPA